AAPESLERDLRREGAEILRLGGAATLDLGETLAALAQRGITRLMVEGGPRVAAAFVRADLIDDAILFCGNRAIGEDGIDALDGLPLGALTQSRAFEALSAGTIGCDRVETFSRASLAGHTIGT
ncbi:MAG: dihydrofolate reductase family protein, partial [Rhodoplanes sp.]